ncbi:MAG: 4Fe-4S double cluster binding domain-containing protein [Acidobacteriota bacterium]
MVSAKIRAWAARRGYRVAFASADVLGQVQDRLGRLSADGAFAPGFAESQLGGFDYPDSGGRRPARTVAVVAVSRPAWVVRFDTTKGGVDAVLPPTYVEYRRLFEELRLDLIEALGGRIAVSTLAVPLKSLAAAAGLVSYGRNNLAYVQPFGSYAQLAAYLIDAPAEDSPRAIGFERMLDRCATCQACVKACPTGAISGDRFLLRADRCYTVISESSGPLPTDPRPPSPDCLIGCLACQVICPENRGLLERWPTSFAFTAEETAALAAPGRIPEGPLSDSIDAKFASLELTEGVPLLRRNLRRLLELAGPLRHQTREGRARQT